MGKCVRVTCHASLAVTHEIIIFYTSWHERVAHTGFLRQLHLQDDNVLSGDSGWRGFGEERSCKEDDMHGSSEQRPNEPHPAHLGRREGQTIHPGEGAA